MEQLGIDYRTNVAFADAYLRGDPEGLADRGG